MDQHHPLLSAGADVETGSLGAGVMVGGPNSGHTAGNRTVWFIQDSCGMVCATMTWFLVLYAEFVVNFVMLLPAKNFWYSLLNGATFNSLAVLALASHLRTMLTDPGAVPKGNATKEYMDSLQLKPECSDFSPGVSVLLLIFLCLEAILFLTFTAVMFGTQIHSICNDETVTVHMPLRGGGKAPERTLPPAFKRKEEERRSANMAAEESVNINLVKVEKVVNRWIVDYYFSLAVEFFKTHQDVDFCSARDILDSKDPAH
ncbi:hypothetical protein XENOCAPTIV_030783 [Xenoophorus captivus]|uniref:Uncharacterized protein n=1 Tax=Xenoophorus captivus TaxID=1517983 RepID=A0ABV0QUK8_9TELE